MQGVIAGKHTRAELGMRAPRSRSLNIRPGAGGSTLHWGGPPTTISSHSTCIRVWKGWQDFHMDSRGWVDIAYTMGFCQHGWVFPGRGYGVRTAAQGSNDGNDRSYAFVHLNETGRGLSPQARAAATWLVDDARRNGRAGSAVWPHRHWHQTDCPGDELVQLAAQLNDTRVQSTPTVPRPPTTGEIMPTLQEIQAGILYYKLSPRYVNPLTILQRLYEMVSRQSGMLAALQQAEAPGETVDVPALAAAIVAGLPKVVVESIDPKVLAGAVADQLAVRLRE